MSGYMKVFGIAVMALCTSCSFIINNDDDDDRQTGGDKNSKPVSVATSSLFPFRDNDNWWMYTEPGGNRLRIEITDTISDDNVTYYRVSFMEERVDTTDDWFMQYSGGTFYGESLTGTYNRFLPSRMNTAGDTFTSDCRTVTCLWKDSVTCNTTEFKRAVILKYSSPIIHGFDTIVLADSIGIAELVDDDGRWTIRYELDSCSIDGTIRRW